MSKTTLESVELHLWRRKKAGQWFGTFYFIDDKGKRQNLKTKDIRMARALIRNRLASMGHTPPPPPPTTKPAESFSVSTEPAERARQILGDWGSNGAIPSISSSDEATEDTPSPEPSPEPQAAWVHPTVDPPKAHSADYDFLAGLSAEAIALVQVEVIKLSCQYFDRNPGPAPRSMIRMAEKGWELQLQRWFTEKPPEPWMIILISSLGMGLAMYAAGSDMPKAASSKMENAPDDAPPIDPRIPTEPQNPNPTVPIQ